MVLLLLFLRLRPSTLATLRPTSLGLLQHLSLLFVPAGVGVMVHWHRLAAEGVAIVVAIVVSTVLALAATALTVRSLLPRDDEAAREGRDELLLAVAVDVGARDRGVVALALGDLERREREAAAAARLAPRREPQREERLLAEFPPEDSAG
jgi:holin-like protein